MILTDVNVLITVFRRDALHHEICKPWLENVIASGTRFGVSPTALSGMIRITTNLRVFNPPSTVEEAFGFCNVLRSQPNCEIVEPGPRHWEIFKRLCLETNTRGPRVSDAWFAALAIEHGCTWITYDRDYARFPNLQWREPAM